MCRVDTDLNVSQLVCFIQCAQFGLPSAFMATRMRVLRHGEGFLLSLPVEVWLAINLVGKFHLMQSCGFDVAKAIL